MAMLKAVEIGANDEVVELQRVLADLSTQRDRLTYAYLNEWVAEFGEITSGIAEKNDRLQQVVQDIGDNVQVLNRITEVISIVEEIVVIAAGIVI